MLSKSKLYKKLSDSLKRRSLKPLINDNKGVALIEFAFVAPVLSILLLGAIDFSIFLVAHQRISRAAYTMSNLLTQMDKGLTERQVSDMLLALDQVSAPFDVATDGIATITAIIGNGVDGAAATSYEVAWKRCYGAQNSTSAFGSAGTAVTQSLFPTDTISTTDQILVVTEIEYQFEPLLGFLPLDTTIEYDAFFRPRRGAIENIVADGSAASMCP